MAVYTDVAFEDLESLLGSYAIGTPRSFKGIAEGVENSNFVLQTSEGTFILTLYEKRVRADELPFFLHLLGHLSSRGVPCPIPVKNLDGKEWTVLNGRPAAILTWLDGLSLKRPDPSHCAAVGSALALLHEAGADFPLVRTNSLGPAGWRDLAAQTLPHAETVQQGLAELIESSLARTEAAWPSGLPQGIIHADLFPDNVLFMNRQVSGLIDFYFACDDAYAYDLAIMLNAWCFETDGAYNVTKGQSLVAGYRKRRPLEAAEIEAFPILASGAALRFLLTRLFDWLRPDPMALVRPKDPREFAKRLQFHRKVRSAAEYGL
jgi:homoserine kinase type II